MSALLLDANALAWTLLQAGRLSPTARAAMANATKTWLGAISIFEIAQKVRIGKWQAMSSVAPHLASYQATKMLTHFRSVTPHERRGGFALASGQDV